MADLSPRRTGCHVLQVAMVAMVVCGCAGRRRKPEPPGPVVRKVELHGVERFEPADFHAYLNLRPTPTFAFGSKYYYITGLEAVDERRIRDLYRAFGYYDVDVHGIDVQVLNPDAELKRQKAKVTITVEEGEPTTVAGREIRWHDADGVSADVRADVEAAATLEPGGEFSVEALEHGSRALARALRSRGHAHAEVVEEAWVDREAHRAVARFDVTPGPAFRIGNIEIAGLERVPEKLVRVEFDFAPGKLYSPTRMAQIEAAIYGLNVFSTVSATLVETDDDDTIDVLVTVTESKPQSVKVGLGIGIDPVRWEQRATLSYIHQNLFRNLTRFSLRLKAGYAELPHPFKPEQHGPIVELTLGLRKKGLLEKHLVWEAQPRFELGIWEGYQFYEASIRLGVSRFFTRYFEAGLSYNDRFVDFFDFSSAFDENRNILGPDFRDPYFVGYIEVSATVHLTDDILEPENGARLQTTYALASTYLGGNFDFHKLEPDLRLYWRPHDRIALAARGRVGLISPYGKNPSAPFDLKFYLGGGNDVRGWPLRRLSPRIEGCDRDGENCEQIPVGGETMFNASAEFRVRAVAELWIAAFFDVGDVREGVANFHPGGWMYSTGGGVRYKTPVGAFRLDFGYRINDDPVRFPEDRRWAFHFGLGEAF